MSSDKFDDSLLDDYDTDSGEPRGEIISDNSDDEKKGSLKMGLLVGIGITLVLELAIGLVLDVQGNLVHRYIAYMLGLIPIFVAAIYTRSVLKMFFVGAPVLMVASFGLPLLAPTVFSAPMAPFLNIIPIFSRGAEILAGLGVVDPQTQSIVVMVETYGILFDLLFGIFVAGFAAIGLTGIVKIVTQKPNILSIVSFVFSMVFLVIGVVLLPYLLVVFSGVSQFGMTFSVGGSLLYQGTEIATDPNGNLTQANALFAEAESWFNQTEAMLQGLSALGLFTLMGKYNPTIKVIVDNGLVLVRSAVDLAQGIAPAMAGFGAISKGMNQAMAALNDSSTASLALLQSNSSQSQFEQGLDIIERGLDNFTDAIPNIKDAVNRLTSDINRDELTQALQSQGVTNVDSQLELLYSAVPLLSTTLDVFSNNNKKGLIDDPNGVANDTERAPIIHLLLGARAMNQVQAKIGETTSFQGTGTLFREMIYHLNKTIAALSPSNNPAVQDLNDLTLSDAAPATIVQLKDQITGTVNFLRDAGNTTISIGQFGIIASPTLTSMNTTMTVLTNSSDFTSLTKQEYNDVIGVFDGTDPDVQIGIVANATRMQNAARNTKGQIDNLESNAQAKNYGFLNDPAVKFADQFRQFNLTRNADNFKYISTGFSSLLKGTRELTSVDKSIDNISGNVTVISSEISIANQNASDGFFGAAQTHLTNANNSVTTVETEIVTANSTLQVSKNHLLNASISFNKTTATMPQMQKTSDSLAKISQKMENIQVGDGTKQGLTGIASDIDAIQVDIDQINTELNSGSPQYSNIQPKINDINTKLGDIGDEINYIQTQFTGIQGDLTGVGIASS